MKDHALRVFFTKEDADLYMKHREGNWIFQASFSFKKSKSFNTGAVIKFDSEIDKQRIVKKLEQRGLNESFKKL